MNLSHPDKIYACVVPAGMADWTEIIAGTREGYEFNGYLSREYVRVDIADGATDRVIAELMDRRLLNDVDDDLWPEIAEAVIKAVRG